MPTFMSGNKEIKNLTEFIDKSGFGSQEALVQRIKKYNEDDPMSIQKILIEGSKKWSIEELKERFLEDLTFGTAGLRAEMGFGYSKINLITIQLATQGVCEYLLELHKECTVVIGYDHRHNSKEFGYKAAAVLQSKGIKVRIYPTIVPTPYVPAAIKTTKADFGIMITASHNPKTDNGYKVFNSFGAQIVNPTDKLIYEKIKSQNCILWPVDSSKVTGDLQLMEEVQVFYQNSLSNYLKRFNIFGQYESNNPIDVIYTPMHGVGGEYVMRTKEACKLPVNFIPVQQQFNPDPNFPTVKFPNPEEGKASLALAIDCAENNNCNIIFANDPDADRFCFCEKQKETGKWKFFTGNEIAAILSTFICKNIPINDKRAGKFALLASCVSSRFLEKLAKKHNFRYESTLTGFKYLGNLGFKLKEEGYEILFAFEEAIGYQVGDWNFDKDGITSLAVATLLLKQLASTGITLNQYLEECYQSVNSSFYQYNSYFFCMPAAKSKHVFSELRAKLSDQRLFIDLKLKEKVKISQIKDYNPSNMIALDFILGDGNFHLWIIYRSSGTEPKLKFYSELCIDNAIIQSTKLFDNQEMKNIVTSINNILLDPELNNLKIKEE